MTIKIDFFLVFGSVKLGIGNDDKNTKLSLPKYN